MLRRNPLLRRRLQEIDFWVMTGFAPFSVRFSCLATVKRLKKEKHQVPNFGLQCILQDQTTKSCPGRVHKGSTRAFKTAKFEEIYVDSMKDTARDRLLSSDGVCAGGHGLLEQ